MDAYQILGLDRRYNVSDAIDSYNTLVQYYRSSNVYSEDEKKEVISRLDKAIESITKKKDSFNDTFNRDFENNVKGYGFGYVETICSQREKN